MRWFGRRAESGRTAVPLNGVIEADSRVSGRVSALLLSNRFVDGLSTWLMAAGLAHALCGPLLPGGDPRLALPLAGAAVCALFVLSLRWWLAPALAALAAGGWWVRHAAAETLAKHLNYWRGFLDWAAAGMPAHPPYSEDGSVLLLQAALVFGVSVAVFILIRRFFAFPLLLAVAGGTLLGVFANQSADLSVPVCLCAASLVVVLPRAYAAHVGRVDKSGRGGQGRASMQAAAVPAALLALLCLFLVPQDTSDWQSRGLHNLAADLRMLIQGPFRSYPERQSNFSMESVGFQAEPDRLGGPVVLGEERVLLLGAKRPVLLRGAVRDYYTGDSWWMGAPDGDFRLGSLLWQRYRREAFDRDKRFRGEAADLYDALTYEDSLWLSYLSRRYSAIFHAGRVADVRFPERSLDEEPYFNLRGELYLPLRIPTGARATVETRLWRPRDDRFHADFLRLEELAAQGADERYDAILPRYTQLPDTLPQAVRDTAAAIVADSATPYEKALAIEAWLAGNCVYTLTPNAPPENADFVAHFLETREGYCTYYASALAVLARCEGLPSRYVTGFALERNPSNDQYYQATEQTAHAWTEIYFQGIGWLEFDPLRWDVDAPLNALVEPEAEDEAAPPEENDGSSDGDSADPAQEFPREAALGGRARVPAPILAMAAALVLYGAGRVALRLLLRRKFRVFRPERMTARYPEPAACHEQYYRDILRQLRLLGLEPEPGETLRTFPARVDRHVRFEDRTLAVIAEARMRHHFAGEPPEPGDVETAARYHHALEEALLERLGRRRYLWRRALRG